MSGNHIIRVVVFVIAGFCFCQDTYAQSSPELKKLRSYHSGEQLNYIIRYGFIHGGEASINLKLLNYEGKALFHAHVLAQSTGIVDKLFSVTDIYESYFEPNTCLPHKAIRNIKEGNYRYYNEVFFKHEDSTLYSQRSDSVFKVPANILDMVSTLYYIRNIDMAKLKKGDAIEVITFFGDEIFPFKIRYSGKEEIKTKFGRMICFRFDPVVEVGRIFESEDDMTIWISDDQNLLPVLVKFDMLVGSIKFELDGFTNLKHELNTVSKK
ncbi:MAG: DUF3108 domain-containing protein [Bacteroidales bacterium]|nr:DUF3108 domain-containing protein [Bacteroidales bacterium]